MQRKILAGLASSLTALLAAGAAMSAGTTIASGRTVALTTKGVTTARTSAKLSHNSSQDVLLRIKSAQEHGRLGPDHTWHDAFLPASFTVTAGREVKVTVLNYDNGQHSITAPGLGFSETISAGSASSPRKVTFSFKAPAKPGRYQWFCDGPCDPFSMAHVGYMRGYITVTK